MSRLDGRVNYDGESRYRKVNYLLNSSLGWDLPGFVFFCPKLGTRPRPERVSYRILNTAVARNHAAATDDREEQVSDS